MVIAIVTILNVIVTKFIMVFTFPMAATATRESAETWANAALATHDRLNIAAKYLAQTQNASDLIGGVSKSGDRYVDHTMFDMVQSLTIAACF